MNNIKKIDWVFFRRLAFYFISVGTAITLTTFFLMGGPSAFFLDAEGFVIHDMTSVGTTYEGEVKEIYVKPGQVIHKGQLVATMESAKVQQELMIVQSQAEQFTYNNTGNSGMNTGNTTARQLEYIDRYRKLVDAYNGGKLYANADGHVGTTIAHIGQIIHPGDPVIKIFQGHSYIIAYVPDNHLFEVKEGDPVTISAAGRKAKGYIEKLLPMSEPLPKQIQHPHTYERRGHTVRIMFTDEDPFPIDQHVTVAYCSKWFGC